MKGTLKQTVSKFIFLFVVPLNILLIVTNSFFAFSTYRQTKISTESMVNYFLDDIDSRLSTISFFLIKNGTEDSAFQSIAYDYVGKDYALEKIHLYQNLNSKIDLCPEISYLFMFHSENNEMVIVPSSEYVSHGSYQAKETLCEMLKNPEQFLNASWTLITLQEAIRLGCLDYILKPITPQQITASIEKCIDKLHHPDKDLYLNQYLQKESLWHDMLFSYISGHEYILPSQTMLDILYYPVLFIIDRQQCNNIQQVADLRYNVQKQIYTEVQTFSPHAVAFSYQLQNIFILFPCKVQYIEEVKQQIKNMYTALVKNSLPLLCVTGYNAKIPVLLGEMKDMLQLDLHGPQNIFEFAEVNESLLPKNSSLVYVVQNYIKEHLEQEICRNTVADYIHMNPDYLDRLFKKEFGLSVSQYIKEKKIDYAKMLLRTTNLSVSEIAQRLGYINLSHFTASFKQITNMTPVNYRKKY